MGIFLISFPNHFQKFQATRFKFKSKNFLLFPKVESTVRWLVVVDDAVVVGVDVVVVVVDVVVAVVVD